MLPGPTPVSARIREAMSRPMIAHRSEEFEALWGELTSGLLPIFGLGSAGVALVLSGSGTGVMESAILSLMAPESDCVVCVNGKFSGRWAQVCRSARWLNARVHVVESEWGWVVDVEALENKLVELENVRTIVVVHSETSTGTLSDLEAIGRCAREHAPEALLVADTITSAGAMDVRMDDWGIDACVLSSQKSPGMPPGAGVVALGTRALACLGESEGGVPLSMDLRWHARAHESGSVACTPPIAHCYGLLEWLRIVGEEGLEARCVRIERQGQRVRDALVEMGMEVFSSSPSPSVSALRVGGGMADEIRRTLRAEHGIVIAGGQEQLGGGVVRIGHMGSVTDDDIDALLEAMGRVLQRPEFAGVGA